MSLSPNTRDLNRGNLTIHSNETTSALSNRNATNHWPNKLTNTTNEWPTNTTNISFSSNITNTTWPSNITNTSWPSNITNTTWPSNISNTSWPSNITNTSWPSNITNTSWPSNITNTSWPSNITNETTNNPTNSINSTNETLPDYSNTSDRSSSELSNISMTSPSSFQISRQDDSFGDYGAVALLSILIFLGAILYYTREPLKRLLARDIRVKFRELHMDDADDVEVGPGILLVESRMEEKFVIEAIDESASDEDSA